MPYGGLRCARPTVHATQPVRLMRAGKRRNFAAEITFGLVDAFAKRKADEARDFDRSADLAFGLLDRLGDGLLALFDRVALLQQANFLVEGLEARLDDLLDHVGGLAFGLGGEHTFFTLDGGSIEPGR